MKLFLDTANLEEIKEVASWGLLDGVTTNPTLCSKENLPFERLIKEISSLVSGPVSVECISDRAQDLVSEARKLNQLAANLAIKIPVTIEGLRAAFVSPFIGRLDDVSHHGMELIEQILTIYENYDFGTEIIVASVRHPGHVVEAALIGAHIATIPYGVMEKLVKHPLTDSGIEKFLQDWKKVASK
jgi:transaldolase